MNINKLKDIQQTNKGFVVKRVNVEERIDSDYIKDFRLKLGVTQTVFASILGVSIKTIEKWEQGRVKPRSLAKRFIYLIQSNPNLINEFYTYSYNEKEYKLYKKNEKNSQYVMFHINANDGEFNGEKYTNEYTSNGFSNKTPMTFQVSEEPFDYIV